MLKPQTEFSPKNSFITSQNNQRVHNQIHLVQLCCRFERQLPSRLQGIHRAQSQPGQKHTMLLIVSYKLRIFNSNINHGAQSQSGQKHTMLLTVSYKLGTFNSNINHGCQSQSGQKHTMLFTVAYKLRIFYSNINHSAQSHYGWELMRNTLYY